MRVALNALHLVPGETGGSEIYARQLVPALRDADPELELTLLVGREAADLAWPETIRVVSLPVSARSRVRRVLAEQTLLPRAVGREGVELLHNLFTTAPAVSSVPQVTTIHDLIYKRFPETHAGVLARGLSLLVPLAARRSRRVIVPSEATKRDLVFFLHVDRDRIDVTYEGPGTAKATLPVDENELRRRFDLRDAPLVLSTSAKRPHKNLERLFAAVASVRAERPPVLLVTGYATSFEDDLRRQAGDRVRFAGWVDEGTLEGLYRISTCLAFPSLAEGFGLPVLEAMRRGVPVVCSNTTSLPEIAGDAAIYFNPTDTAAITAALEQVLARADVRERLAAAGRRQAQRFSWKATAQATLASYRRALE